MKQSEEELRPGISYPYPRNVKHDGSYILPKRSDLILFILLINVVRVLLFVAHYVDLLINDI